MSTYRAPEGEEVQLIRLVAQHDRMNHEDPRLEPFCDDSCTAAEPDIFSRCHDLGWLWSTNDSFMDESYVRITDAGRQALAEAA